MLKEFSLEGKTALITGGSTGIGKAIALVYAEAGADVAISARRVGLLEEAAEEIRAHGHKVVAIEADVSDPRQVDKMAAKAIEEMGRVDILVNNAGGGTGAAGRGPIVPLPDAPDRPAFGYALPRDHRVAITEEGWNYQLNFTLSGAFYCARAIVPQMLERRQGKVINIASTNAVLAYPYSPAYQSCKAGLKMLTKVMANEWGRYNINVNVIAPGFFVTDAIRGWFEERPEWGRAQAEWLTLRRFTDIRDMGLLALYLGCPASDWMTGQLICLDGGETSLHD